MKQITLFQTLFSYMCLTAAAFILIAFRAFAVSPPNIPLPVCQIIDGEEVGACPSKSDFLDGVYTGRFSVGASVEIQTLPTVPICVWHNAYTGPVYAEWSPSPCFPSIIAPRVNSCAVIDLSDDGKFKEMSCSNAFYGSIFERDEQKQFDFKLEATESSRCSGAGDFATYFGGLYNGGAWVDTGSATQTCNIRFEGDRPDRLLGPTWVKVRVAAGIAQTGEERRPGTTAFTEIYVPIDGDLGPFIDADFNAEVFGQEVTFINTTVSSEDNPDNLRYEWDFGDGNSSNAFQPTHTYSESGIYEVTLSAENDNLGTSIESKTVETESGLIIELSGSQSIENGTDESYKVKVGNFEDDKLSNFSITLSDTQNILTQTDVPAPAVLSNIEKNQVFISNFPLKAEQSGETILSAIGEGSLVSGDAVAKTSKLDVAIQPKLMLDLSAPFVEASGEDVTITLTVTNKDEVKIEGIRVDSLFTLPNELLEFVSGPLDQLGQNPSITPFALEPQDEMQVNWIYRTKGEGIVDLQGGVSFDSITEQGRALQTVDGKFAIEVAALEYSDLRIQPAKLIPGEFAFIRGKLNNIGKFDIKDIDFELIDDEKNEASPNFRHIERLIENLDNEISPRIDLLEAGKSHEFIIPVGMTLELDSETRYTLPLTFSGKAIVDPEDPQQDVDVSVVDILRDDIDRTEYWIDILDEYYSLLVNGVISIFNEVDDFGESSLIGGISVGSAEGVITAFQKMGDGLLSVVDFLGETSGDQGEQLTLQAQQMLNVLVEYNNTTNFEEKMVDLAEVEQNITVGGVDIFVQWMFDVEQAANEGDSRKVASLFAEPATNVATGIGAEKAGAQIFAKLLQTAVGRKILFKLTKKFEVPNESSGVSIVAKYIDDLDATFDDLPVGVPLTGRHALMAGVEGDDLAFMLNNAKETNATFFVRPRPSTAAKWSRAGYNGKPLPVKMKSVSQLDSEWLGYNSEDIGLVVLQKPEDPTDKLRDAIANGVFDIDEDRGQIQAILDRYSAKLAEFENLEATITKLNSSKTHKIVKNPDPANPDLDIVEEVVQEGIVVKRYGRDVITTVSIEPGTNRLIFDYNGKPVYSDIDLLSVARRDGSNLSPTLHKNILKESSYGFDGQHHATAQTSDFPKAQFAQKTAQQYMTEHMRGGEGLLIISPEGITKGYVESFDIISLQQALDIDAGDIKRFDYQLYGAIVKNVRYSGVQTK